MVSHNAMNGFIAVASLALLAICMNLMLTFFAIQGSIEARRQATLPITKTPDDHWHAALTNANAATSLAIFKGNALLQLSRLQRSVGRHSHSFSDTFSREEISSAFTNVLLLDPHNATAWTLYATALFEQRAAPIEISTAMTHAIELAPYRPYVALNHLGLLLPHWNELPTASQSRVLLTLQHLLSYERTLLIKASASANFYDELIAITNDKELHQEITAAVEVRIGEIQSSSPHRVKVSND